MRILPVDPVRRGRVVLVLLGCVFLLPIVAATIANRLRLSTGETGNYGELIAPTKLEGEPFAALRGKWVLVMVDGVPCDGYCERKLYLMRQLRRAQGREMSRVERLWLVSSGQPTSLGSELKAAIEGTRISLLDVRASPRFAAESAPSDHLFLVDPQGNLMMRFGRDPDPARVLKDLSRLLRYSTSG